MPNMFYFICANKGIHIHIVRVCVCNLKNISSEEWETIV